MFSAKEAQAAGELLGFDFLPIGETRDELVDVKALRPLLVRLEHIDEPDVSGKRVHRRIDWRSGYVLGRRLVSIVSFRLGAEFQA